MRRLPLMIIVIGLLTAGEIGAQQPTPNTSQVDESTVKPCVVVLGAVRNPARFELQRPVRLAEVVFMAGGVRERAADMIKLSHSGSKCFLGTPINRMTEHGSVPAEFEVYRLSELVSGVEKANPYVQPGDVVIVTEVGSIYMLGNVKTPQEISRKAPLTLTQALEIAGGLLPETRTNKIAIYRAQGDRIGALTVIVDLKAIKKHRVPDPVLQPYDIIDVPSKKQIRRGDMIASVDLSPKTKLPTQIIQ